HLIIDGVSWRVLLADLWTCYQAALSGTKILLPNKTQSYQTWSQVLGHTAQTPTIQRQKEYWQSVNTASFCIPTDKPTDTNNEACAKTITVCLSQAETQQLSLQLSQNDHLQVVDILLASVVQALAQWAKQSHVYLHMEGHGREIIDEEIDISRTVGWFTTIYPMLFSLSTDKQDLTTLIKMVKQQLHSLPNHGSGYGLLRYLNNDKQCARQLQAQNKNLVSFNYLGQFDYAFKENGGFQCVGQPVNLLSGPTNLRCHMLEITAWIYQQQLHIAWRYNKNWHQNDTIEQLAQTCLQQISTFVRTQPSHALVYAVPADFPLIKLTQQQLDKLTDQAFSIDDIWPLSGIQQGLLFHHLYQNNQDTYQVQVSWQDSHGLNLALYKQAWEQLIATHQVLRACFIWQEMDEPVQLIASEVHLPWCFHDWREYTRKQQTAHLKNFLTQDKSQIFDIACAPLMRINVFQLSEQSYHIVWTHHHILLGGWSMQLVFKALYATYQRLLNTTATHSIEAPTLSYKDYLCWLRHHDQDRDKAFWLTYLKSRSDPQIFAIGNRASSSVIDTPAFDQLTQIIDSPLAAKLQQFSRQHRYSLNTVMQFTWCVLISHYSRCNDVMTGITVSVRPAELQNIDHTIGLFINTLPFRLNCEGTQTIHTHLQRVQALMLDISHYHHVSLVDIYEWLGCNSQETLLQSLFIFENYPVINKYPAISNLQINDGTHYPLTLAVFPNTQIRLALTYQQSQFDKVMMQQMLQHYQHLLKQIVAAPTKTLSQISLLTPIEHQQLLTMGTGAKVAQSQQSLAALFADAAQRTPDKIAVVYEDQTLSYAALNQRANQLAHMLKAQGVQVNTPVAIYLDRSIEMVVALLGVLKAGGAYVPIDRQTPRKRILYVLQHTEINVVLCAGESYQTLATMLADTDEPLHLIDLMDQQPLQKMSCEDIMTATTGDDLAYIIYTSGTTGQPKGVLVSQKGVVNVIASVFNTLEVIADDVLLAVTSLGFDISALEILGALLTGLRLVIAPASAVYDGEQLKQLLQQHQVTLMQATPSTWHLLLAAGWQSGKNLKILCGGEKLSQSLAKRLLATGASVWNAYGPTEASIYTTITGVVDSSEVISIGKPVANIFVCVLDQNHQLVSIGSIGELYIGGIGVAQGYLNDPTLTNTRFIEHRISPHNVPERLYRTGDLVRWLPTGELAYIERIDHQVKIRGFRIELAEIETYLLDYPDIKQCAVIKVGEDVADQQLLAYCTTQSSTKLDRAAIYAFLTERLPAYMIPSAFISLSHMPLTISGKIDRRQLAKIPCKQSSGAPVKPSSSAMPTEQVIAKIFAEVLNLAHVSVQDSFFALGGHSIKAIQLLTALQQRFAIMLKMRDLFTCETPAALTQLLSQPATTDKTGIPSPLICLQKQGDKPPLFLVHPVGGTIFWLASVARYLGRERPIYALQDPGLEMDKIAFSHFEEMAEFYVAAIIKAYPQGPYLLGGASFGANMAVEMARQLLAQGKAVQFIGLLDGWAFYPDTVKTREFLQTHMRKQHQEVQRQLAMLAVDDIQPFIDLHWHRAHLLANHPLTFVDAHLTVFKAAQTSLALKSVEVADNHWSAHCRSLELISVPGDHETMFYDPHVQVLAYQLLEAIEQSGHLSGIMPQAELLAFA
ncbi:MAG: amino acid adenylation domain-containing protein, partial [Gammaproteobacteria bacterium]